MAKGKYFFLFILFAVIVGSVSCSKEQEQKVDQQYLDSQDYAAFKESTNEELKSNDDSNNLADDLIDISDCGYNPDLEARGGLDWELLERLTENAEACQTEKEGQRLTPVGVQSY